MRNIALFALLAAGFAVSAPAAVLSGLDLGYMTDRSQLFYSARLGYEFKAGASLAHQLEIEIGYTKKSQTSVNPSPPPGLPLPPGFPVPGATVTTAERIVPVLINYRVTVVRTPKLSGYFGAGLGEAEFKYTSSVSPNILGATHHQTAVQGFAGLSYKTSDRTLLHLDLKRIWFGRRDTGQATFAVDPDFILSAGIGFRL